MDKDVVDFNADDTTPTNTGHAIVAIALEASGDVAELKRSVDALVRDLRASPRLPGVDRIWLPGEQSHTKRIDHVKHGVPLPPALRASLDQLARELASEALA
jgi:L-2-hydroxycarboxylate dehydrogenase (NAD+)